MGGQVIRMCRSVTITALLLNFEWEWCRYSRGGLIRNFCICWRVWAVLGHYSAVVWADRCLGRWAWGLGPIGLYRQELSKFNARVFVGRDHFKGCIPDSIQFTNRHDPNFLKFCIHRHKSNCKYDLLKCGKCCKSFAESSYWKLIVPSMTYISVPLVC